jgi:hypothetical protein
LLTTAQNHQADSQGKCTRETANLISFQRACGKCNRRLKLYAPW